jgi:hypothetical protein
VKFLLTILCSLLTTASVFARLGDTEDQAIARYGIPERVKSSGRTPLIENARELTFEYQGWRIRCALLLATDGKEYIVREEYTKIWNTDVMKKGGVPSICDFERDAILEGESKGLRWTRRVVGDLSLNPIKGVCESVPPGRKRTDLGSE